jgi:hypothetical protein
LSAVSVVFAAGQAVAITGAAAFPHRGAEFVAPAGGVLSFVWAVTTVAAIASKAKADRTRFLALIFSG